MAARTAPRSATFAFDLSKPLKKGFLLKQGQLHRAFKNRFFVLYPGFLVYYADQTKWKYDLTKGETLGSRVGAIKLKGGSVSIARDAPKGCKFGVVLNAPDLANKRKMYLVNASSKEERDSWIEAIGRAVPSAKLSPKAPRKDEPPQRYKTKLEVARPTYTARQDTANEAALAASEQEEVNETETNIDVEVEPSISIRHDTANVAALAGAFAEEEEDDQITNFDDELVLRVLGPQLSEEHDSSDEGSSGEGVRSPTPLEADEKVEETVNRKGKLEVVTSVTVTSVGAESEEERKSSTAESVESDLAPKENGREVFSSSPEEPPERKTSEVTFPQEEQTLMVSVAMDDSDTSSSEEDDEPLSPEGEPEGREASPVVSLPPVITVEKADTLNRKDAENPTENGEGSGKEEENSDSEKNSLIPEQQLRQRRGSTPFFEKRGFLYKMGGKRKNWKLRYFVLQPGTFSYYKKDPRSKPLGEVKLKNLQIYFPAVGERQQSFQFTVHTESSWNKRPNWVIAAQSEREMKDWITGFKLAGTKGLSASPTPEREMEATEVRQNGVSSNGGLLSPTDTTS